MIGYLKRSRDQRKAPRRRHDARGWIKMDSGFSARPCKVADLSTGGVRLILDDPRSVADNFSLLMSRDERHGRACRVTWRKGAEIGATFVTILP